MAKKQNKLTKEISDCRDCMYHQKYFNESFPSDVIHVCTYTTINGFPMITSTRTKVPIPDDCGFLK